MPDRPTTDPTDIPVFEIKPMSKEDKHKLIAFLAVIVGLIPLFIYENMVVRKLWNWFVPDAIPGIPAINAAQAAGLSTLIAVSCPTPHIPSPSDRKKFDDLSVSDILAPLTNRVTILAVAHLTGVIAMRRLTRPR